MEGNHSFVHGILLDCAHFVAGPTDLLTLKNEREGQSLCLGWPNPTDFNLFVLLN